jgi:glutaredoxin
MKIKIYSTPGCFYCTKLKELFERANITDYDEQICTSGEEVRVDYPEAGSFPYVIIDGEEVGGLVETARLFVETGIVSSKNNERS